MKFIARLLAPAAILLTLGCGETELPVSDPLNYGVCRRLPNP